MHIPYGQTRDEDIETFAAALEQSLTGCHGYDGEKWIYVPHEYREYRYLLGTRGKKPLICIGINPSTAAPDDLDNTLKSVERIAHGNGYDSFIMFNVYAQRATRPDDMENTCNTFLHSENMAAFEYILRNCAAQPAVWAAWGTIIEKRNYLFSCVADMIEIGKRYGAHWLTAGKESKAGHPHHPLYLRSDEKLRDFDVYSYMRSFLGDSDEKNKCAGIDKSVVLC